MHKELAIKLLHEIIARGKFLLTLKEKFLVQAITIDYFNHEALENWLQISWRIAEIPSQYKFPDRYTKIIAEHHWLELDFLSTALVQAVSIRPVFQLNNIFLCLAEDIPSLLHGIEQIINVINDLNLEETPTSLNQIDSFASYYLDQYCLTQMIESIDMILRVQDNDQNNNVDSFKQKSFHFALLRTLEILGECAKLISCTTREMDLYLPWHPENAEKQFSILTNLRSNIEHILRYRALQIAQDKPELYRAITHIFPSIKRRLEIIKLSITPDMARYPNEDLPEQNLLQPFQNLYNVLTAITLPKQILTTLESYIASDILKRMLRNIEPLPETQYQFIEEIVRPALLGPIDIEPVILQFHDAYRKLQGKKIDYATYQYFTTQVREYATLDTVKYKSALYELTNYLNGTRIQITRDEFLNGLEKIPFIPEKNKHLLSDIIKACYLSQSKYTEHKEAVEKILVESNLDIADIHSLFDFQKALDSFIQSCKLVYTENNDIVLLKTIFIYHVIKNNLNLLVAIIDDFFKNSSNTCANDILIKFIDTEDFSYIENFVEIQQISFDEFIQQLKHYNITQEDFLDVENIPLHKSYLQITHEMLLNSELTESEVAKLTAAIKIDIEAFEKKNDEDFEELSTAIHDYRAGYSRLQRLFIKYAGLADEEANKVVLDILQASIEAIDPVLAEYASSETLTSKINSSIQWLKKSKQKAGHVEYADLLKQDAIKIKAQINCYFPKLNKKLKGPAPGNILFEKLIDQDDACFLEGLNELKEVIQKSSITRIKEEKDNQGKKLENYLYSLGRRTQQTNILGNLFYHSAFNHTEKFMNDSAKQTYQNGIRKNAQTTAQRLLDALKIVPKAGQVQVSVSTKINRLFTALDKLASLYVNVSNKAINTLQDTTYLAIQFMVEEIGNYLGDFKDNADIETLSGRKLSRQRMYLLNISRKLLAHYPLVLRSELIHFFCEDLILIAKLGFKHYLKQIENMANFNKAEPLTRNELTVKTLDTHLIEINAILEYLGLKPNPQLFCELTGCKVGRIHDLNLIVELSEELPNIHTLQLLVAEERLSQLLKARVNIYTDEMLVKLLSHQLLPSHLQTLRTSPPIHSFLIDKKFANVFNDERWSCAYIPNLGMMQSSSFMANREMLTTLQILLAADMSLLMQSLSSPEHMQILLENSLSGLHQRIDASTIIESFESLFIHPYIFTHTPVPMPKYAGNEGSSYPLIVEHDMSQSLIPMHYPVFLSSANYDEKNADLQQLQNGVTLISVSSLRFNFLPFSFSMILGNTRDNKLVVKIDRYFAYISQSELKKLYIERNDEMAVYHRADHMLSLVKHNLEGERAPIHHLHSIASYFSHVIFSQKHEIITKLNQLAALKEQVFSKATHVDYVFGQDALNAQRHATEKFRYKRLMCYPQIQAIIDHKAVILARTLIKLKKSLKRDEAGILFSLLDVDKQIDRLLKQYYLVNEFTLTFVARRMDATQRMRAAAIRVPEPNYKQIDTLYDFIQAAKGNRKLIPDVALRNQVDQLCKQRSDLLDKYTKIFLAKQLSQEQLTSVREAMLAMQIYPPIEYRSNELNDMLYYAYNTYLKYYHLLFFLTQETISLIKNKSGDQFALLKTHIYHCMIEQYLNPEDTTYFIQTADKKTLTMASFNSEVEYVYTCEIQKAQAENKEKCLIHELIAFASILNNDFTILSSYSGNSTVPFDLAIPEFANGIIGASSELDRELMHIHGAIAAHRPIIKMCEPDLSYENFDKTLTENTVFKVHSAGKVDSTIRLQSEFTDLESLMVYYGWTEAEKEKYENYAAHDLKIQQYYSFRNHYDNLTSIIQRLKEYQEQIEKHEAVLLEHQIAHYAPGIILAKEKLYLFTAVYIKNFKAYEIMLDKLMHTDFVLYRTYLVLTHPTIFTTLIEWIIEHNCFEEQENIIKKSIKIIHAAILHELYHTTNFCFIKHQKTYMAAQSICHSMAHPGTVDDSAASASKATLFFETHRRSRSDPEIPLISKNNASATSKIIF